MKRYLPLTLTALLFFAVVATQTWLIATSKPASYLIVGGIVVFLGAAATMIQLQLLIRNR